MPPNTFRGCATGREGMPAYSSLKTLIGFHDQFSKFTHEEASIPWLMGNLADP